MYRSELFAILKLKGFVIDGTDPEMVLSTMLWRQRDKVVRLKSGGYWIAGVPLPPREPPWPADELPLSLNAIVPDEEEDLLA